MFSKHYPGVYRFQWFSCHYNFFYCSNAGTSGESYIRNLVTEAAELGYRVVVFNNRGNGAKLLVTLSTLNAAMASLSDHFALHLLLLLMFCTVK